MKKSEEIKRAIWGALNRLDFMKNQIRLPYKNEKDFILYISQFVRQFNKNIKIEQKNRKTIVLKDNFDREIGFIEIEYIPIIKKVGRKT